MEGRSAQGRDESVRAWCERSRPRKCCVFLTNVTDSAVPAMTKLVAPVCKANTLADLVGRRPCEVRGQRPKSDPRIHVPDCALHCAVLSCTALFVVLLQTGSLWRRCVPLSTSCTARAGAGCPSMTQPWPRSLAIQCSMKEHSPMSGSRKPAVAPMSVRWAVSGGGGC